MTREMIISYGNPRSLNGVQQLPIGSGDGMPWGARDLPTDNRHFRTACREKTLVMEPATHERIGATLVGNEVLIVTQRLHCAGTLGARAVRSLEQAYEEAGYDVLVCGGAELYVNAMRLRGAHALDAILATEVHADFPSADTFLCDFRGNGWRVVSREPHRAMRGLDRYDFDFAQYELTDTARNSPAEPVLTDVQPELEPRPRGALARFFRR